MTEIILGIFVIVVVGFYLFRPTSKQEEKDLKSKNNWRGGFWDEARFSEVWTKKTQVNSGKLFRKLAIIWGNRGSTLPTLTYIKLQYLCEY